jgi:hypothetical protein
LVGNYRRQRRPPGKRGLGKTVREEKSQVVGSYEERKNARKCGDEGGKQRRQ